MQKWAQTQLTKFGVNVENAKFEKYFSSKTHDVSLKVVAVSYDSKQNTVTLTAANDDFKGRFKFVNPTISRVKELDQLIGAEMIAVCNYAQYTASYNHRRLLSCFARLILTTGVKSIISTSNADQLQEKSAYIKAEDFAKYSALAFTSFDAE